jgi:hypothetical protein
MGPARTTARYACEPGAHLARRRQHDTQSVHATTGAPQESDGEGCEPILDNMSGTDAAPRTRVLLTRHFVSLGFVSAYAFPHVSGRPIFLSPGCVVCVAPRILTGRAAAPSSLQEVSHVPLPAVAGTARVSPGAAARRRTPSLCVHHRAPPLGCGVGAEPPHPLLRSSPAPLGVSHRPMGGGAATPRLAHPPWREIVVWSLTRSPVIVPTGSRHFFDR